MKVKIEVLKDWRLKKPIYTEMDEEVEKTAYSLQVLENNNVLPVSIRMAQNVTLHKMHKFENYGVYINCAGSRQRFYVWEHMIPYFLEEIKTYKYTHSNKDERNV